MDEIKDAWSGYSFSFHRRGHTQPDAETAFGAGWSAALSAQSTGGGGGVAVEHAARVLLRSEGVNDDHIELLARRDAPGWRTAVCSARAVLSLVPAPAKSTSPAALSAHSTGSGGAAAEPVAWIEQGDMPLLTDAYGFLRASPAKYKGFSRPLYEHPPVAAEPVAGWKLVPDQANRDWAYDLATHRQGQSSTPRCEPPSQRDVDWAMDRIREVLAAAPPPPAGGGETMRAAREALGRMKTREGEDVDQWADRLGADLAAAGEAEFAPSTASPAGDLNSLSAGAWRIGRHYGLHVYEGDRPVATFHSEADASRAVAAVNAPAAPRKGPGEREIAEVLSRELVARRDYDSTMRAMDWIDGIDDAAQKIAAILSPADRGETQAVADPLVAYLERQWAWSKETFGPALRTKGIVQHITKELREIEADPHDLAEWVDVIILAMDGFWRHGGKPSDLLPAMQAKQDRNFARTWPDWRTMGEDQAIEHDRSGERDAYTAEDALRSLASWLGVGGYNASAVDPDLFEKKIRDGVDMMLAPWVNDARRYRKLRGIGAAPGGTLHLDEGLVFVATNLDAWLDAALAGTPIAPSRAVEFDPAAWPRPPSPDQNRGEPDQGGANTEAGR